MGHLLEEYESIDVAQAIARQYLIPFFEADCLEINRPGNYFSVCAGNLGRLRQDHLFDESVQAAEEDATDWTNLPQYKSVGAMSRLP